MNVILCVCVREGEIERDRDAQIEKEREMGGGGLCKIQKCFKHFSSHIEAMWITSIATISNILNSTL